jgi:hypothetical protein
MKRTISLIIQTVGRVRMRIQSDPLDPKQWVVEIRLGSYWEKVWDDDLYGCCAFQGAYDRTLDLNGL